MNTVISNSAGPELLGELQCEKLRSIFQTWEKCRVAVYVNAICVYDIGDVREKMRIPLNEVVECEGYSHSFNRQYCIKIKTLRHGSLDISIENSQVAADVLATIKKAHSAYLSSMTGSMTAATFLTGDTSKLDGNFNMLLVRAVSCNSPDELKTILTEIATFQYNKIEVVMLQLPFYEQLIAFLDRQKQNIFSRELRVYANELREGFEDLAPPDESEEDRNNALMEPTRVVFDQVAITEQLLGTGKYSQVYRGRIRSTNDEVAIKVSLKSELDRKDTEHTKREARVLHRLRGHKHIIHMKAFWDDDRCFYLCLELAKGGELFDAIVRQSKYSERDAQVLVRRLLYTLRYCHERGIVHRDLKPENILLADSNDITNIKISDFGFAIRLDSMRALPTHCGTPGYMAPEILQHQTYSSAVDMWALGVITYILLCGYPPFSQDNDPTCIHQICNGNYKFDAQFWDGVSEDAKDFIRQLIVVDPNMRATATQACNLNWMRFESTRTMHMDSAVRQMSKLNRQKRVLIEQPPKPTFNYYTVTECYVFKSSSTALPYIQKIPERENREVDKILYTLEGTWLRLAKNEKNEKNESNWICAEQIERDPMCIPAGCVLFLSNYPRHKSSHTIRHTTRVADKPIGKIPGGFAYIGTRVIETEEGVWIELHKQTLWSFRVLTKDSVPVYVCVRLGNQDLMKMLT